MIRSLLSKNLVLKYKIKKFQRKSFIRKMKKKNLYGLMASMSLDDANATGSASGMHSRIASRKKSLRRYELAGNGAGFGCATYPMRRWPSWRRNRTASFMARLLSSITDAGRREALRASRATAGICMLESKASQSFEISRLSKRYAFSFSFIEKK